MFYASLRMPPTDSELPALYIPQETSPLSDHDKELIEYTDFVNQTQGLTLEQWRWREQCRAVYRSWIADWFDEHNRDINVPDADMLTVHTTRLMYALQLTCSYEPYVGIQVSEAMDAMAPFVEYDPMTEMMQKKQGINPHASVMTGTMYITACHLNENEYPDRILEAQAIRIVLDPIHKYVHPTRNAVAHEIARMANHVFFNNYDD